MDLEPDNLDLGAPFVIGATVYAALAAWAAALLVKDGSVVVVKDNPVRLSDLDDARVVFVEDVADRLLGQPGAVQQRQFSFNIGVINRTQPARLAAHKDYRAAKRVVRSALQGIARQIQTKTGLREGDVSYRIENLDVGGGLVLGTFTLEYRDPG